MRPCLHNRGLCVDVVRALEPSMGSGRAQSDVALWRRALSALLLASFFWISYAAQTHIHGGPSAAAASASVKSTSGKSLANAPSHNRSDDAADCPLCQAAGLGRAIIVPLLFAILILQVAFEIAPFGLIERIPVSYFGCGHQTRAPPIL